MWLSGSTTSIRDPISKWRSFINRLLLSYFSFFLYLSLFRYFVLGLPTGSTPLGMYKELIEFHKQGKVSFRYVKTFNMDEYVGEWLRFSPIIYLGV